MDFYPANFKQEPKKETTNVAWKGGFTGAVFNREEWKKKLDSVPKEKLSWIKFLVVHNTGAPSIAQADKTPGGYEQRMKNLGHYFKNEMGWQGGPNDFVFKGSRIGEGTPLPYPGVHSRSFNGKSYAAEMVADFDGTDRPDSPDGASIVDTTAWMFAQLLLKLGLPCDNNTVKLHKEDPATSHDCPGPLFKKDEFLRRIKAHMDGELPIPVPPIPAPKVIRYVNTPGDTLNFRATPAGRVKGSIYHGLEVEVVDTDGAWSQVKTPGGYLGWVSSKYLSPAKPVTAPSVPVSEPIPVPKPPAPPASEPVMQPGSYRYSDFCREWAKRFEGFRSKAYWDVSGWAVGYGHNSVSQIPPIPYDGFTISMEDALLALEADLKLQLHYLEAYVDVPLTQGWVDALVLHIFQQGPGNFRNGPVRPLVNAEKWKEAAARIKQGIGKNANLLRRRDVESQIALGGKPTKW